MSIKGPMSNKKEWNTDPFENLDETRNNYTEWKKPDNEEYILCNSTCIKL